MSVGLSMVVGWGAVAAFENPLAFFFFLPYLGMAHVYHETQKSRRLRRREPERKALGARGGCVGVPSQ